MHLIKVKELKRLIQNLDDEADFELVQVVNQFIHQKNQQLTQALNLATIALNFYRDLKIFGKTVWEDETQDGKCWYEEFDSSEIGEIYHQSSTGDFGIKAEDTLDQIETLTQIKVKT